MDMPLYIKKKNLVSKAGHCAKVIIGVAKTSDDIPA